MSPVGSISEEVIAEVRPTTPRLVDFVAHAQADNPCGRLSRSYSKNFSLTMFGSRSLHDTERNTPKISSVNTG
jgi:hypothetical protein